MIVCIFVFAEMKGAVLALVSTICPTLVTPWENFTEGISSGQLDQFLCNYLHSNAIQLISS